MQMRLIFVSIKHSGVTMIVLQRHCDILHNVAICSFKKGLTRNIMLLINQIRSCGMLYFLPHIQNNYDSLNCAMKGTGFP